MAIPKPNGSGLFVKYDIALFSNHLAESKPQPWRRQEMIPTDPADHKIFL
jgi:hypothetical protein